MKYGAAIVETRPLANLCEIIRNHMKFLPFSEDQLTIFYGKENEAMLREAFPKANFNDLLTRFTPVNFCNEVMTSFEFWESMPYDKVLMFQSDSEILRTGIEEFYEWDYVGSPWEHLAVGGNGGFSFRNKHKTLELLRAKPFNEELGNEDEYYSKYLGEVGGKVAPREVCLKFGVESVFTKNSFGCHAIDKHLSKVHCEIIRGQYENN